MKYLLISVLFAFTSVLSAQLNTTLRSNLDYDEGVNDVWGYVAPDGTEYAIVGLLNGVSFVSLADPDNAVEVARINGVRSDWRDMKTFGEYAYTVADEGDEGITAFDLTNLPDGVTFTRTQYTIPGYAQPFIRAHNLYISPDRGVIYTSGGDFRTNGVGVNRGGILMFDITADPMNPVYIGKGPEVYSHDVFVLNDTMYSSDIFAGELSIYDISDLDNVEKLGSTPTPFTFTHNAWTPTDGQTIFTTDERANAPVAAYDISDKDDIKQLFEFRPIESLNKGAIPHNVHVIDDYLSISYYTDGLRVADASVPDNVIEVANYDTWPGADGGFNGAWGAYPFLPSGLTLISDRQTGLYVVGVDYKRAARLRGTITDRSSGLPINDVRVNISSPQINTVNTDALGEYRSGLADGGEFEVTISALNYSPITVPVSMINGETVILDTSLVFSPPIDVTLNVVDDLTGQPIEGASFRLVGDFSNRTSASSANGEIGLSSVNVASDYELFVAEWGYRTLAESEVVAADLDGRTIRLTPGYMDDFITDEGWTAENDAPRGGWVRDVPIGTSTSGVPVNPGFDAPDDIGNEAYVTGNGAGSAGTDDVDDGVVTLTSPKFGPLDITDSLKVGYQYWFFNGGGAASDPLDDTLTVSITNGIETVVVRKYSYEAGITNSWNLDSFIVSDFVAVNDELQLIVSTSDFNATGHWVEAGLDNFRVGSSVISTSTDNHFTETITARVFPNPAAEAFNLTFVGNNLTAPRLRISDASGRILSERSFTGSTVRFGRDLPTGFYFAELFDGNRRLYVGKIVKQ